MENPIKMDELGGPPLFLVQHPYVHAGCCDQFGFQVWNTSFCTEFVAPKRIVPCFFFLPVGLDGSKRNVLVLNCSTTQLVENMDIYIVYIHIFVCVCVCVKIWKF